MRLEPDYMVTFSPGWNIVGLHAQLQPGRKTQRESLLRCKNAVDAHARLPFSARDGKSDSDYMDFSARLARLKILARFENTGLGFKEELKRN